MSDHSLVIVESPSKAKTIGRYLGDDYEVRACMGHLRDLPASKLGVDIESDFEPLYQPMSGKTALINELKKAAEQSSCVYLATDPDREGEAISWHLRYLLNLDESNSVRVTFNEITKKVVLESIASPRNIDQNLVDAQQARRVLDRIVGYQLSPVLWKKVRRGLSAGRVQSVAVRLVVDREEQIRAFIPEEYWTVDVSLLRQNDGKYDARYYGETKKRDLHSKEEADQILSDIQGKAFEISKIRRTSKKSSAPPPFITSTLQQEASRKLNMTPKRTMALAQQLYEGVEIAGIGAVGLITYMRTDSLRLSDEALSAAKSFILENYGKDYYYGSFHQYKANANAQDAHEAIRPTNIALTPESVASSLNKDQLRLYRLIWTRFAATQMAPAEYSMLSMDSICAGHIFRSSYRTLVFDGFTRVYDDSSDEQENEATISLPGIAEGEQTELSSVEPEQHFTQPPARYTEASLVRAMEENGVGRPSTYATIIATIQDRDYVEKQEKHLHPTPLGETVNTLLEQNFSDIVDVEFTANMEKELDSVESGDIAWKDVLRSFYGPFEEELEKAESISRMQVPDVETEEVCELCGRKMVIKNGKFGKFLACPGFPECRNAKALVETMPGRCPKCGSTMVKRKSGKGYTYYACEKGKECGFMTWDVPTDQDCPYCGQTMFKRAGKGRNTPFCINENCQNFLPEDKRGYYKKKTAAADSDQDNNVKSEKEAVPEKKSTAKNNVTIKKASEKTAARKTVLGKSSADKDASVKKTTVKKSVGRSK